MEVLCFGSPAMSLKEKPLLREASSLKSHSLEAVSLNPQAACWEGRRASVSPKVILSSPGCLAMDSMTPYAVISTSLSATSSSSNASVLDFRRQGSKLKALKSHRWEPGSRSVLAQTLARDWLQTNSPAFDFEEAVHEIWAAGSEPKMPHRMKPPHGLGQMPETPALNTTPHIRQLKQTWAPRLGYLG